MTDRSNNARLLELEREHQRVEAARQQHATTVGDTDDDMAPFLKRQDRIAAEMQAIPADTAAGLAAKLRVSCLPPGEGTHCSIQAEVLNELARFVQ